jgi:hypothetical protein
LTKKPKLACKVREYDGRRVLWPADHFSHEWISEQPLESLHWVSTHKPRSPQFHRAVHKLCCFLAVHHHAFNGMDAHAVLKRLQLESTLYCDKTVITIKGFGDAMHLVPQSMSFDSMDETEFRAFHAAIVEHVQNTHWPEFGLHLLDKKAA